MQRRFLLLPAFDLHRSSESEQHLYHKRAAVLHGDVQGRQFVLGEEIHEKYISLPTAFSIILNITYLSIRKGYELTIRTDIIS